MLKLLSRNKKYLLFTLVIMLIGFVSGVIYYILLNEEIKLNIANTLLNNSLKYNSTIKDLIIMSSLFVTSFFIIGIPLNIFYLFYEFLSYGFLITIFTHNYGISGLIYGLLITLLNKLLVIFIIIFFLKKLINISRLIIGRLIYKNDSSIKNKLLVNVYNALYIIVIVFVLNLILNFINPKIFSHLTFLLK